MSITVVTPRACSRIAASIQGYFGVGRVEKGHRTRITPAGLKSISFHTYVARKKRVFFVTGDINIKRNAEISLNGDKQPFRCAPKVSKRGISLSLFDFSAAIILQSNR